MNRRHSLALGLGAIVPTRVWATAAPFRVAVIGHTGRGNYGHGLDTMWQHVDGCQVVALADADAEGRRNISERLSLDPADAFADYGRMLREVKPEIVAVAPRHVDQHHDMCLAAIESGARGLYVEKPFCATPAEADAILAAARQHGTRIAVAHRNRYHPVLPRLKQWIEEGLIGEVLEWRCRGKEDRRGGGEDLWVLGSHLLNLAHFFMGPARAAQGLLYQDERVCDETDLTGGPEGLGLLAGNRLHARFDMENGLPLSFDSIQNRGAKQTGYGIQCHGTKGVIHIRIDQDPLVHLRRGHPFVPDDDPRVWRPVSSAGVDQPEPEVDLHQRLARHQVAAEDLLAALRQEREPLCNGAEAAHTVEMIHGVFHSHRQGGKQVALPLAHRGHGLLAEG